MQGICLEVNVRVLEGESTDVYAIDSIYAFDGTGWTQFLEDVYPALLTKFEAAFEDAQLQYFEP